MWEHYCEEEGCVIAIGKGEPCNWCNMTEETIEQRSSEEGDK